MNNQPAKFGDLVAFRENDFPIQIEFEDSELIVGPVTVEIWSNGALYQNAAASVVDNAISATLSVEQLRYVEQTDSAVYVKFGDEYVLSAPLEVTMDGAISQPRLRTISYPTIGTIRVTTFSDFASVAEANAARDAAKIYRDEAEGFAENAQREYIPMGDWNRATNTPTLSSTAPAADVNGKYQEYVITNPGNMPFAISNVASGAPIGYGTLKAKAGGLWFYDESSSAALTKVNEISSKFVNGQNLFDYETMTEVGSINTTSGALTSTGTSTRSTSILVAESAAMVISNRITGIVIRFEDAAHALISFIAYLGTDGPIDAPVTFTTPAGTKFIRFTIRGSSDLNAPFDKLQLEYGSVPTAPKPYFSKINKFASTVVDGAKLANPGTSLDSVASIGSISKFAKDKKFRSMDGVEVYTHNLVNPDYIFENKYLNTGGSLLSGLGYRALIMPVTAGQTYKIAGRGWDIQLHFYSNNTPSRTLISSVDAFADVFQFTVPVGATYLYASIDNSSANWATTNAALQVYTGVVTLPYEPYGIKNFTLTHIEGSPVNFLSEDGLDAYIEDNNIPTITASYTYSHNLANPAFIVENAYLNNLSGNVVNLAGTRYIVIPVTPGQPYKIQGRGWDIQLHFFDTNLPGRTKISTVQATTDLYSFTVPAGAHYMYATIDQTGATWATTDAQLQIYEGTVTLPYAPYGPASIEVTEINGIPWAREGGGSTQKTVRLKDREVLQFWGNSYSEGYPALPTKDYISVLSQLSDWSTMNYGASGNDVGQILARVRSNSPKWKAGVMPKTYVGGGYAIILELTNSVGHSMITAGNGYYDLYMSHIANLCDAANALGLTPILANEWQNVGGDLLYAALSEFAYSRGLVFADVFEKARFLKGANYAGYYANAHPGVRTNSLLWSPLLPFIKALPRPKWGIKIFRKRTSVSVSTVADLAYKTVEKRAALFREIRNSAMTIKDSHKQYFDDLATLSGLGFQTANVYEYDDLMTGLTVAMADYGLIEFIINATSANVQSLRLFVGGTGLTTYIYDHVNQTWDSISNTDGWINVTNFQDYIGWDKVSVLIYNASAFTIIEPYLEFTGAEGKQNEIKPLPRPLRGTNLLTTPNFNGGTTGWTVTGTLTPAAPSDNSMPSGITQVVVISSGNYATQTATIVAAATKRRAQLIIIARFNPPTFSSSATYPDDSPITEDTFDFATMKIQIGKGSSFLNYERLVGLWWQEVVVDFDVFATDTAISVKAQYVDKNFEVASMSLIIES